MIRPVLLLLAAVLSAATFQAAQARPRDDVMAGAFHCAAIGDSRQWLDCYYGAAQPVRAELGLAPAPASQVRLTVNPPTGPAADTPVRDAVMAGAFRCNDISDERKWLDCYYAAAQPMRGDLGLSQAPQAPAAASASNKVEPKRPDPKFGLPQPDDSLPADRDHVVSRMRSFTFDQHGKFVMTLANGQVWYQLAGDTEYARWKEQPGRYVVTISRGWFGSFNLQVRGLPGLYKVRRQS
jgi:hypothetical protein